MRKIVLDIETQKSFQEVEKERSIIYAKIKKPSLEMKFGVESKYRDMSKSSALFLSQEFKF